MNDAPSVQLASNDADATPGALLKRERERAALTVQQAAEDLHLDPWIIEAIEENRFLALGAPVYARGHLRKYATRLGLPVDDIVTRYEALQDRPHEADPIPAAVATPIRPLRRSLAGPAWIAVAIAVLALGGYFAFELLFDSQEIASPVAVAPSTAPVVPEDPTAPAESTAGTNDDAEPAASTAEAPQPSAPEEASPAATTPTVTASTTSTSAAAAEPIRVRLEFTGECWTEVYDATGARLLFGMGTPQRVRTLVGVPPIQINLGAASAVNLQVNGESVVIPRREGRESARFTIEADGNLR